MKKLSVILLTIVMLFSVVACNNNNGGDSSNLSGFTGSIDSATTPESDNHNSPASDNQSTQTSSGNQNPPTSSAMPYEPMPEAPKADFQTDKVIYLAGDSTVKTYAENTYIGGWGQFLHLYLKNNTVVENKSNGGRSSRSFINEGRLTTNTEIKGASYESIESTIKAGDYLLIQFGHNDDASGGLYGDNYLDRNVPLGDADENGIFPTVVPTAKVPTSELPAGYVEYKTNQINQSYAGIADEQERKAKIETEINKMTTTGLNKIKAFGSEYYSFDCGGTFKGYLKMYIDFARSKGAIPILCTPVARVKFDDNGKIIGGANRHGENFAYVQSVRQLAEEEKCLLIDTFEFTKNLLELVTKDYANYLMALKPNGLSGKWPFDYDAQFEATGSDKKYTGIEATHYNKFGAYVTAAYIAETLNTFVSENTTTEKGETITFGADLSLTPSFIVECPSHLEAKLNDIKSLLKNVKITK